MLLLVALKCAGAKKADSTFDERTGSPAATVTRTTALISAQSGGYVTLGSTRLTIPAGALESDTPITAEYAENTSTSEGLRQIGAGIRFSPEGLQFLIAPELRICYENAEGLVEDSAGIHYRSPEGQLIAISGTVDRNNHCVNGHIEHFSTYIAAARLIVTGNTPPAIGAANFLPSTPLAGIPLRVRTQIDDMNGSTALGTRVPGTVASAFLYYRSPGAASFTKVPLTPDTTDDSVTNRYAFVIPAAQVTLAGIEYYFEATDNLNSKRTTSIAVRNIASAANGIRFNPGAQLTISSGFARSLTLQASANAPGGPWQNISAENFSLSDALIGSLQRTGPSTIRFNAIGAGTATIMASVGQLNTNLNTTVVPGLLNRIAITDANHIEINSTMNIPVGQTQDIDAIGYDNFGNVAMVLPQFIASGSIGTITVNASGAHFAAATTAASGSITALLSSLSSTVNVNVYVPPEVLTTIPVDAAYDVSLSTTVTIAFTKVMNTQTLTATTDTSCTGSIQVSADNFMTCVAMQSATPQFTAGETTPILTPAAPLHGRTTYRVRVLNSVQDSAGYGMLATYTSTTGFTTVPDISPPQVISTMPGNNATNVDYATPIVVTFDRRMLATTLTAANISLLCASQTIPMSIVILSGDSAISISPQVLLPGFTSCLLTITTGVQSDEAVAMITPFSLNFTVGSAPVASTVRDIDIVQPSKSAMFTAAGGKTFFVAQVPSLGRELWSSDGTFGNTQQIRDIYMGINSSDPDYLTAVGQKLFFVADDGVYGRELWASDGTQGGTLKVKDIFPGSASSNINILCVRDGIAYFSADDGIHGQELWRSDGTASGTNIVIDLNLNLGSSNPSDCVVVGNNLYFSATDGSGGYELWKSDGTMAGTTLVKDIFTGVGSSYPRHLTLLGTTILFSANDGIHGEEIWKSDGTSAGTQLISEIAVGSASSLPSALIVFNGKVYFTAEEATYGRELWQTDGSQIGLVKDITPGSDSSNIKHIIKGHNGLYLVLLQQSTNTYDFWFTAGTAMETVLFSSQTFPVNDTLPPDAPAFWGGRLYFAGFSPAKGSELWSSNGTAMGTTLVRDTKSGPTSGNPQGLGIMNGTLFFRISDKFSAFPPALWKYE